MHTPDSLEWRQRCAYRLRRQWPSVPLRETVRQAWWVRPAGG